MRLESLRASSPLKGFEQPEEFERAARVFLNLDFEDSGILELHFIAQPEKELDFHFGLRHLAVEIQQKRLHREIVIPESGLVADVGH